MNNTQFTALTADEMISVEGGKGNPIMEELFTKAFVFGFFIGTLSSCRLKNKEKQK